MTSFFVEKINILEYAFGEGGGGHQKAYAVYAFINVDNCERPLTTSNRSCRFTGLGCHGWIINWLESNAALTTILIWLYR